MGELMALTSRRNVNCSIIPLTREPADQSNQRLFESCRLNQVFGPRLRGNFFEKSALCRCAFERQRLRMSKGSPQSNARPKFNYAPAAEDFSR